MISTFREGGLGRERVRDLFASFVSTGAGLRLINRVYNLVGERGKRRLYLLFAKIYVSGASRPTPDGDWCVRLSNGGELIIPVVADSAWLDWDLALSSLGNDQEVKSTYATLLRDEEPPAQFIDVGANYGSHSLIMMAAGVPALSFEPNPVCNAYFRKWAARNGLHANLESVALGSTRGEVSLDFPPTATWLGMISRHKQVPKGYQRVRVPLRKLDNYQKQLAPGKLLIKLDAEGAEPNIIRGAGELIADRRPWIIFECWCDDAARYDILDALANRFAIYRLPWQRTHSQLTPEQFVRDSGTNFLAVPHTSDHS